MLQNLLTLAAWIVITMTPTVASAQAPDIPQIVTRGLDSLIAGKSAEAVAVWGTSWVGPDTTRSTTLRQSLAELERLLGAARGYDFVAAFDIGPNIRQIFLVIRFDKQPLFATFHVYRPTDDWQVNAVSWNTDAAAVFPRSLLPPSPY